MIRLPYGIDMGAKALPLATAVAIGLTLMPSAYGAEPTRSFTLEEAVAFALEHSPGLRAQESDVDRARAEVDQARAGYLPSLDLNLQANRATGNVVAGAVFPMPNVPVVSGPVLPSRFDSGVFGTGASLSASWNVLGLLQHMASVDGALQSQRHASEATAAKRLNQAFRVADLFLGLALKQEAVKAARSLEDRARVFAEAVRALVAHELRPGVDLSRAEAEMALAAAQVIRAEQARVIARVELAEAMGLSGHPVSIDSKGLDPGTAKASDPVRRHPVLREADADVALYESRKHAAQLQLLPRLEVVTTLWVRKAGDPVAPNWAAGLVLSWPILELFSYQAHARAESVRVRTAEARREELEQGVQADIDRARAILEGAREVADVTPAALKAAQSAEQQVRSRYQSGLATANDVADAQHLLADAELQESQSRLGVRAAMLLLARALGDLQPFLAASDAPPTEAR